MSTSFDPVRHAALVQNALKIEKSKKTNPAQKNTGTFIADTISGKNPEPANKSESFLQFARACNDGSSTKLVEFFNDSKLKNEQISKGSAKRLIAHNNNLENDILHANSSYKPKFIGAVVNSTKV